MPNQENNRNSSLPNYPTKPLRWRYLETDPQTIAQLQAEIGLDPVFCQLLVQRGIFHKNDAVLFFRPDLTHLHDPFQMRDMDAAVQRLEMAIEKHERILLYGDYDVDGTTSVALMYAFLSSFYHNIDYYLPDREKEGYGVSMEGIAYAQAQNCKLLIAMDCGIKAHAAVEQAKTCNVDVIICDHHLPEGALPNALAILDPKRSDCNYPYKDLSGCGIAFKLAQAFAQKKQIPSEKLENLLDLAAISIACDIVPITGENRVIASLGLKRLNQTPRTGLWALIQRLNKAHPLHVSDLVFGLGPMINSAGRLGDARDAVRLMLATERNSALDMAGKLVHRNRQRRTVDYATAAEARQIFTNQPNWQHLKSIVLFQPDWHKGIIGIAASRLAEEFHRPSVVLTLSNQRAVGSARSVPGFDLYAALQDCQDLFFSFGGHAFAAGMQMPAENVPEFTKRFEKLVHQRLKPEDELPLLEITAECALASLNYRFWKTLSRFEPFGPHNRNPVFWAKNVVDTGKSKLLDNNHVRFHIRQADGTSMSFSGIGYGLGARFQELRHTVFDIAYNLREENWNGQRFLALTVKDLLPSGVFSPSRPLKSESNAAINPP